MTQDSSAIWKELMSNWQTSQKQAAEHMLKGFEAWNNAMGDMNASINNPVLELYQSFFKSYSPLMTSGFTENWESYLNSMPSAQSLAADIKSLMQSGETLFENISKHVISSLQDDESNQYLLKALMDMSNPNSWLKYSGDQFDIGAHKLSEGPLFSGISDIDTRIAQVSDSWLNLLDESKKYHAIVFAKWTEAYSSFLDQINNMDEDQRAELSPRKLIEMWSNTANQELLQLHRSEAFLNAQRAVTKASMQYRLHEKNVAEVICEALHIPTRDEVDDLHKTVTELRREVRQLKAQAGNLIARPQQQQPSQFPGRNLTQKTSDTN